MRDVVERTIGGIKALEVGVGPPLLALRMATEKDAYPRGLERRMTLTAGVQRFAEHFRVIVPNAPLGIPTGASLSDVAEPYAAGIEEDIGEPVFVHAVSTGGAVALRLAIDHPSLLRRLVLVGTACRLSEAGRRLSAEASRLVEAGEVRRAMALLFGSMVSPAFRYPIAGLGWLAGPSLAPEDLTSSLAITAADVAGDAEPDLDRVTAATLLVGGEKDAYYPPDLVRLTADGIPGGRAVILEGKNHSGVIGSRLATDLALGFLLAG